MTVACIMVRLLVLTISLGLAACQRPKSIETVYSNGKEYLYDYESQILSGLPQGSRIYSGFKLKAQVRFQLISSSGNMKMELRNPKIYSINSEIGKEDSSREMLPMELFQELLDMDSDKMKRELIKPLSFSFIRGHIEDLVTEGDDPEWSVNVKRGCISLMEVNFNERQSLDPKIDVLPSDPTPSIYRVIEPSITGECETTYRLKSDRSPDGSPSMDIEKVRNFNRCLEKVIFRRNMMNWRECEYCDIDEDMETFTAQSSVRYSILGSPDQFLILRAVGESQYNFVPYLENRGRVSTFLNQTLTLLDSRPISDQIPEMRSQLQHERPLKANTLEEKSSSSLSPWKSDLTEKEKEEYLKKTWKVLVGIEKLTKDKMEDEVSDLLLELGRLLKKLDKTTLNKLTDEIIKDPSKYSRARKTLLDLLPTIGTYDTIDVLLERIEKQELPRDSVIVSLMSLSLLPQPDVFIVKRFMNYITVLDKTKSMTDDQLLRRSAWLCLGSLGGKMLKMNKTLVKELEDERKLVKELREEANERRVRRRLDKKLEHVDNQRHQIEELYSTARTQIIDMVTKLHEKTDRDYKLLALKTMNSLGYDEFYPLLEKLINDMDSPLLHRMEAITSLQKLTEYNPDKVKTLLLPLFFDRKQPEEMRMIAYLTSILARPSRPELEMIAKSLEDEPSTNVGTLVWMSLVASSNKMPKCDCIKSLARNSTMAMRFAQKSEGGLQHSNYMYRSSYDKKTRLGHSYEQVLLHSAKERFPRAFAMQYTATLMGKTVDLFELGYKAKGVDTIVDRMYGVLGDTSMTNIIRKLFDTKFMKTVSPMEQELLKMKEKLEVKSRFPEIPEGHVYMKLFGQELIYFDLPSMLGRSLTSSPDGSDGSQPNDLKLTKILPELMNVVISLNRLLKTQKSAFFPLMSTMLPTETGLPLRFGIDKVAALKIDGDVKFEKEKDPNTSEKKFLLSSFDSLLKFRFGCVFEIRGNMEVDFKYIRSTLSLQGRVSVEAPVTLAVNVDTTKSKLLLHLQDEKEFYPVKMVSRPSSEIRRMPSDADRYPIPPDVKEIIIIDGADVRLFSYDIGKDTLGRKLTVNGEMTVSRDDSCPLPPLNGRQVLYIKYEPLTFTGLDIQMQRVREVSTKDPSISTVSKQTEPWWLPSWLSGTSTEEQSYSGPDRNKFEKNLDDPNKGFIVLDKTDLSLPYIKKKFERETELMKTGVKCGMVIRVSDHVPQPKHQIQLTTLYQSDSSGSQQWYSIELMKAPKSDERMPWKMMTTVKLDLPETVVKPSFLLDNEYQKFIQDQIKVIVTENGKQTDSLLDLGSKFLTKAIKQLYKLQRRDSTDKIIEDVVSHVLERSVDKDSAQLRDSVQEQRKLLKETDKLKKQLSEPRKLKSQLELLKKILLKTKLVSETVSKNLDVIPWKQQKPEDSVMVLYVVSRQTQLKKKLRKIVEKLHPLLTTNEKLDLESKLKEQKQSLDDIRMKQNTLSLAKQSTEEQKSRIEMEPKERSLQRQLLDIEQILISVSMERKNGKPFPSNKEKSYEIEKYLNKVIEKTKKVKDEMDERLLQKVKIDKMLRVKLLEVLLHQKLTVLDIEDKLLYQDKKQKPLFLRSPYSSYNDLEYPLKKENIKLKDDLQREFGDLARRLAVSVDCEIETDSLVSFLSSEDQQQMDTLQKLKINQLWMLELLRTKSHPSETETDLPTLDSVKETVHLIKESHEKIKDIVETIKSEKMRGIKQMMNPVLIKSLKIISKQFDILNKVKQIIKHKMIVQALKEDEPKLESYKLLKREVFDLKENTIKELKKIEHLTMKDDNKDMERSPTLTFPKEDNELPSRERTLRKPRSLPVSTLLKKALKVQTKQLQMKAEIEKLSMVLDVPQYRDTGMLTLRQIKQKQIVYDVIGKAIDVQDELEELNKALQEKMEDTPEDKSVRDLIKVVDDRQDELKKTIKLFEDTVEHNSRMDNSLVVPLEKLQQLKDRIEQQQLKVQKTKERFDQLREAVDSDSKRTLPKYPKILPSRSSMEMPNGRRIFMKDLRGVINIAYGPDGETPKKVEIRLFGKKSLSQLFWELDQFEPSKQDPLMRKYLQERREPNDAVAKGYEMIADELNTYRHLYLLCIYEDSLPVEVRALFWRMQEYMKYRLYDRTSLRMPDETNMKNEIQILTEIKRDNKWADVEIKTPYETMKMHNLRTPQLCKLATVPNTVSFEHHVIKSLTRTKLPATCELSKNRIKMFRGKTYEIDMKPKPCTKVLAMDCSPSNKFAITSSPHSQQSDKTVVTLVTKTKKVEIVPDPDEPKMTVKVNDEPVEFKDEIITKDSDSEILKIRKLDGGQLMVTIPQLSVIAITDGEHTSITVGSFYWSKVCGVCGHLGDQDSNSLQGPQKVLYPSPEAFVSTYLLPDDQCDVKSIQSQYNVPDIRRESKHVQPKERTNIIKHRMNGIQRTCFSKTPVKSCPSSSRSEGTETRLVSYYCLRSSSRMAQSLIRLAQTRVLDEVRTNFSDLNEYIREPKVCKLE